MIADVLMFVPVMNHVGPEAPLGSVNEPSSVVNTDALPSVTFNPPAPVVAHVAIDGRLASRQILPESAPPSPDVTAASGIVEVPVPPPPPGLIGFGSGACSQAASKTTARAPS